MPPRSLQEACKRPQEAPRGPQKAPKTPPRHSREPSKSDLGAILGAFGAILGDLRRSSHEKRRTLNTLQTYKENKKFEHSPQTVEHKYPHGFSLGVRYVAVRPPPGLPLLGLNPTQRAPKGRRRIQPAEREPRRRPNGDILHAQREAMRIVVLYRFGGMLKTLIVLMLLKVLGLLRFSW